MQLHRKIGSFIIYGMIGCITLGLSSAGLDYMRPNNSNIQTTHQKLPKHNVSLNKKPDNMKLMQKPTYQASTDINLPARNSISHWPVPSRVKSVPVKSSAISERELPLFARIIHAEAGGESLRGQVAVGAVLLNRIRSGKFPNNLRANIFRPGEFESVSNGYIWSSAPAALSYKAARLALKGWDPTYGALYFFNPAKTRSRWIWSRPIIVVIGQHNFAA